jgi:anti-anti-sigma factor
MKYALDKNDKYAVLKLEEDNLNSTIAPDLKSEFVFLYNEGVRNLILDLSDCKFVDSSGLSSILVADRLWKNLGSFILTGINHSSVKQLIEISRLDTVLTLIPTLEEAVEYVHMEEIERELNADVEDGEGGQA